MNSEGHNESTPPHEHTITPFESTFYYSGISPSPPRLVYRTSKDPFVKPKGPEAYGRLKQLYPVYERDHKLGTIWEDVCPKIRDLLDEHRVYFSSIDVVHFCTAFPDQQPPAVISPIVIWIGVLPNTLSGQNALKPANAILALLKDKNITDIDIEFRESVFRYSVGAVLYEPAFKVDPIRHVIDPLTTTLGLPVAAAKTPHLEGTMGFYFKDGNDLYGVTARHVLFPLEDHNSDYSYNTSGPRLEVLLMGTGAWDRYLDSINTNIRTFNMVAESCKLFIENSEKTSTDNTSDIEEMKKELEEAINTVKQLKELYGQTTKDFGEPRQRVIGHVVWSPTIGTGAGPHEFTMDVCVIKLDKARFLPNFKGNAIDLGIEIDKTKFIEMMHPRIDVKSNFKYPADRLFELKGILTEHSMRRPSGTKDHNDDDCLYVIKRGLTTLTTIGRGNGLFSCVREYNFPDQTRHQDSVEWAIFPYYNNEYQRSVFSGKGDSGSIIASSSGEFGGLLTGGTGMKNPSDITYATPMFWLWSVITDRFPNADLCPVF